MFVADAYDVAAETVAAAADAVVVSEDVADCGAGAVAVVVADVATSDPSVFVLVD